MEEFLEYLARRIMYIYGGKNRSVTIEEVIIKPDKRHPVYKNNYMLTIVLNVIFKDDTIDKLYRKLRDAIEKEQENE